MTELLAFSLVAVVVIVTPGQDTALTVRSTLAGGRRAGPRTAAGVVCGQAVWVLAASVGVAALLVASEPLPFSSALPCGMAAGEAQRRVSAPAGRRPARGRSSS